MNDAQPKSRGGRPQKFPGEGPRVTQATRLRSSTASQLAEEADRNHRSIGEEIEYRINKSFDAVVVDVDQSTRVELSDRAQSLNQSVEDHIKHIIASYRIMEKHTVEILPVIREFLRMVETFRAAQVGLVLMSVMDDRSTEIGSFLQKRVAPGYDLSSDLDAQRMASSLVKEGLDKVSLTFEEIFGSGSLNEVGDLIDTMLISYVEKHTGRVIDRNEIAMSFKKGIPDL